MLIHGFSRFLGGGPRFFNARMYSYVTQLVRVSTIDHDGCFGLPGRDPSEVRTMHAPIINALREQKKSAGYTYDYVMSYSNRQNRRRDCQNAIYNQNNLAFPVADTLAKALDAHFDPLLLEDIYLGKKPGYTISRMKAAILARGASLSDIISDDVLDELMGESEADNIFSEDKINILYPQTHRIALFHPNGEIHFQVYDDLMDLVLYPSIEFFRRFPTIIPRNVILHFHHFDTIREGMDLPREVETIIGQGTVDPDYYKTVMVMGEIAQQEEGENRSVYRMAKYLTPKRILEALAELNHQLTLC